MKIIDLSAPFGVEQSTTTPDAYRVVDAEGVLVGECPCLELAGATAAALNGFAANGVREVGPVGEVLELTKRHPQGGTIAVRIPTNVPGAGPDYIDIAVADIRALLVQVEMGARLRHETARKLGAS